jgi:hypothetical protein
MQLESYIAGIRGGGEYNICRFAVPVFLESSIKAALSNIYTVRMWLLRYAGHKINKMGTGSL